MWLLLVLFLFSYIGEGISSLDIQYFCLGEAFMEGILKFTGSRLALELSCCDCVEVKSQFRNFAIPPTGLEPMSHTPVVQKSGCPPA